MKKTDNFQTSNAEMVTISRAEYEEFQAQRKKISELEGRVDVLMEALRLARHKQFGVSSEKSEETLMEQLSFLFNEAEVFSAADKEDTENVTVVAAHKRHKKQPAVHSIADRCHNTFVRRQHADIPRLASRSDAFVASS